MQITHSNYINQSVRITANGKPAPEGGNGYDIDTLQRIALYGDQTDLVEVAELVIVNRRGETGRVHVLKPDLQRALERLTKTGGDSVRSFTVSLGDV